LIQTVAIVVAGPSGSSGMASWLFRAWLMLILQEGREILQLGPDCLATFFEVGGVAVAGLLLARQRRSLAIACGNDHLSGAAAGAAGAVCASAACDRPDLVCHELA